MWPFKRCSIDKKYIDDVYSKLNSKINDFRDRVSTAHHTLSKVMFKRIEDLEKEIANLRKTRAKKKQ